VTVGKRLIIPRIQTSVDRLDAEGVDVIALLCSGVFTAFRSRAPVLLPHAVIDQEIQSALGDRRRVAVLLPLSSQIEPTHRRFGGNELLVLVPLPPDARTESVHDTALDLRRNDVDLVVLRCFSYPTALRDALAAQGFRRTILARAVLADLLVTPPPGAKQI
jgi:protein AroM